MPGAAWPGRTATVCHWGEDSRTSDKPQNKARDQDAWVLSSLQGGGERKTAVAMSPNQGRGRKEGSPQSGTGPAPRKQLWQEPWPAAAVCPEGGALETRVLGRSPSTAEGPGFNGEPDTRHHTPHPLAGSGP